MATIDLFFNFTPNKHDFAYFKYDSLFFNYLKQMASFSLIECDNARLMNNSLIIDSQNDNLDYTLLTYVRENRDGFIRYYFVDSVQYFGSNKYQYVLIPDLWANYIGKATFDHILLERCNRFPMALNSGKFDEITNVTKYSVDGENNVYNNYIPLKSDIPISDIYIAFSVVWQSYKQTQIFANTITASDTRVFCAPVSEIGKPSVEPPQPIPLMYIENAIKVISGIYAINNGANELDAYVSNMYLVTAEMIPNRDETISFSFKTAFQPNLNPPDISVSNGLRYLHNTFVSLPFTIPITPDSVTYFGTKTAMIKLPRVFDKTLKVNAFIESIVKKDEIQIIARCGDDQLDITQSFSLGIPNTTGQTDSLTRIARGVSTMGSLGNAVSQMSGGHIFSGIMNAFNAGFGIVQEGSSNAQYKNNGDGLTTWAKTSSPNAWSDVQYPISYTKYKSAYESSESTKVNKTGAIFSQFIDTIDEVFDGIGITNDVESNTVFLKASLEVVNIPLESAAYIAEQFKSGIQLLKL